MRGCRQWRCQWPSRASASPAGDDERTRSCRTGRRLSPSHHALGRCTSKICCVFADRSNTRVLALSPFQFSRLLLLATRSLVRRDDGCWADHGSDPASASEGSRSRGSFIRIGQIYVSREDTRLSPGAWACILNANSIAINHHVMARAACGGPWCYT